MAFILHYLQFILGRLLYPIRNHESRQIIHSPAFHDHPEPNMTLDAVGCGPSGSDLPRQYTCLAEDGVGCLPELCWDAPESEAAVKEYVLICEDIDLPIPSLVIHHGLFWAIPASVTTAVPADIQVHDGSPKSRLTRAGWRYIPNLVGSSYIGAGAPLGHGKHRYLFTIIALNAPLQFDSPEKASKQDIKQAMIGKVIGWGQWIGHFERPWPN
ncbi:Phosphatidylethanolamine-binding protein PEBP [Penicillium alfredii]|uniref:Phosphatidylethanolamine-binding protein PEBP n=1 Tax=Penicillium alfredii TaxID=1506179 RepID=A0A9W9K399_9EURO|nr:Phosphatidylethanolamine-binding protein PEBP [Penicillium alfredii]KAJ5091066.1 Phosphatidylethanolamine-binding protein PEBP [Penicillium alfredii]